MTDKTANQERAEQYLKSIREKIKAYQDTLLEIEALEYAAAGVGAIRYDKEHVDGGQDVDRMFMFATDAVEKRAEAEELLLEVDELKYNCYHYIRKMDNADERIILEWLYINAMTMQEVIRKLYISERKAYNIREDALEHFGAIM